MKTYRVTRQHYDDRQYWAGEERSLSDADARALMDAGLLEPMQEKPKAAEPKAAPAPENKQKIAPANKAG